MEINNILILKNVLSEQLLGGFSLEDISFEQAVGERIAIIGETGAGKSTLLKTIAGFIQPVSGDIFFNDHKVMGPNFQLIPGEKGIAYLSQHFELRNNYRVEELLDMANELPSSDARRIEELCDIAHLVKRKTNELSGGEKQRVALAKQLLTKPQLLILDEPFSNLDPIHKNALKRVIDEVAKELNITMILSSHEPNDILSWAETVIVMRKGRIEQIGTTKSVYFQPKNDYVAELLGYVNKLTEPCRELINSQFQSFNSYYLRPEQIIIFGHTSKNVAKVVNCISLGNHYLMFIDWNGFELKALSFQKLEVGTDVKFNFAL